MAEHRRHPELIDAFRRRFLHARRAHVQEAIAEAQGSGAIRDDMSAERLLDLLAGPILARAFSGADVGDAWKQSAFADWWTLVRA